MQAKIACVLPALLMLAGRAAGQAGTGQLTPEQEQALKQGTALFIILLIALLLMFVAVVIATITLRRRLKDIREKDLTPTDASSLWWPAAEKKNEADGNKGK